MGLGLGNVRNTLEKYHGTMKTEETKEEFQVRLMPSYGKEVRG